MSEKFQVICADPPWGAFADKLKMSDVKRGALANYSTMTTDQIASLPIKDIADPNGAVLALWVPSSLLQEGLNVMHAWGFNLKQTFIWIKIKQEPFKKIISSLAEGFSLCIKKEYSNFIKQKISDIKLHSSLMFGLGRLFRQTHEICLIGTNNNAIYKQLMDRSQRSVCFATNLKHSAKPEALQNSLEIMFPNSVGKIELFARRQRSGWVCLGNEIGLCEDIRTSLQKLIDEK
jgi:N6-adenosine-specific RNA methylase IME4